MIKASMFSQKTAMAVLFILAISPTLLVKIPAMEDYLDDLGRMYVLTTAGTINANPYYQVAWALYSNLAMDIVVPAIARFMDVETAERVFLLTSQLLVVSGAIALELSVKRRHELAGFAALMALYSMPFSLGLINFEFGAGVALWGIATWIWLSAKSLWQLRFLAHIVCVAILFVSHFFALGIYGLTVGLLELEKAAISRTNIRNFIIASADLIFPAAVMLWLMSQNGASVGENDNEWWFAWKPVWFLLFLNGYNISLAVSSAAALAILCCFLSLKKSMSMSTEGKWVAVGFVLVFVVMPFKLLGSRMADIRMITAAFLVLPAFLTISPRFRSVSSVLTIAIIVVNVGFVSHIWFSYRLDYAAMKASFALIRPGSFVLVAQTTNKNSSTVLSDAPFFRAPTLAVYYADAFVSSLYTLPGQHVVKLRSDLSHLQVNGRAETYGPPELVTLAAISRGATVANAPQYVRNWTRDFDYLYLLGPPGENALPDLLEQLTADRRFTLYRVRK